MASESWEVPPAASVAEIVGLSDFDPEFGRTEETCFDLADRISATPSAVAIALVQPIAIPPSTTDVTLVGSWSEPAPPVLPERHTAGPTEDTSPGENLSLLPLVPALPPSAPTLILAIQTPRRPSIPAIETALLDPPPQPPLPGPKVADTKPARPASLPPPAPAREAREAARDLEHTHLSLIAGGLSVIALMMLALVAHLH